MPGMKAGPELDERLCQLLEPRPHDRFAFASFWEWNHGECAWHPIPVSADWVAMGKVVEELETRNLHIRFSCRKSTHAYGLFPSETSWELALFDRAAFVNSLPSNQTWLAPREGDDMKHALALAAVEALEKKQTND